MIDQLPAIVVVIPLLTAALCAVVRQQTVCWLLSLAAVFAALVASSLLLGQVLAGDPVSYAMGGWAPPIGIELRVDALSGFMLVLVAGIALVTLLYARKSVQAEIASHLRGPFYAMMMLCITGLLGIVVTGDAFNAFVFLEISSLSTYTLIAMGRDRRALAASYQYLIIGTIGATLYVIGLGLLYNMTGTLNMVDLADKLKPLYGTGPVLAAMAFVFVGIALKVAMFPLHLWLPNAYAFAPSATSVFLSATATKVSIYLLVRYMFGVFDVRVSLEDTMIPELLITLSVAAIFAGSLVAIFQENLKRMLAYSSVAQIGYMLLGIGLVSATGLTGTLVHMFNHAIMKGGLFMLMGGIALHTGNVRLSDLQGAAKQMPYTMLAFVIAGLSMLGVPGTVGFVSKWYLALAAIEAGMWWLVFALMLSSLLVVAYMGRVIEVAYFRGRPADAPVLSDPPKSMLLTSWVMIVAMIYLGIDTELTAGVATKAVDSLITMAGGL